MSRISLVTVTYNGALVWPEFLSSLMAQAEQDWHLIVIDNASSDNTVALVKAVDDPRITLVANDRNVGVAAANNQGIEIARARGEAMIVLINNDTAFGPELLERLIAAAQATDAGAVSALIPYYDRPDLCWYGGGHFSRWRGMLSLHDGQNKPLASATRAFKTDYAPTCCVLFKTEVFDAIGLMDEAYFVYWDDVDFLWRMKRSGIAIVVDPASLMLHKVSISTGGRLSDFSIRYGHRNQIYFARKFFGVTYAAYVSVFASVVGVARMVLAGDTAHHLRVRLAAIREGWRMPMPARTPR